MVHVFGYHRSKILLVASLEVVRIVIGILVVEPHVAELVYHIHAQFVACVEHALGERVVCRADRIETPRLEAGNLAEARRAQIGCAEDAVAVVHAASAELDARAIHEEAFRSPCKVPDAEADNTLIAYRAVDGKRDMRFIKVRLIGCPKHCFRQIEHDIGTAAARGLGARTADLDLHVTCAGPRLHAHAGRIRRDGRHAHAIEIDMVLGQHMEPHGPVDARAGIPARVGLCRVVGNHSHLIDLAGMRTGGELDVEARIAVRMEGCLAPVEKHASVAIDALELELERTSLPSRQDLYLSFVAVDAAREVRPGAAGGSIGRSPL